MAKSISRPRISREVDRQGSVLLGHNLCQGPRRFVASLRRVALPLRFAAPLRRFASPGRFAALLFAASLRRAASPRRLASPRCFAASPRFAALLPQANAVDASGNSAPAGMHVLYLVCVRVFDVCICVYVCMCVDVHVLLFICFSYAPAGMHVMYLVCVRVFVFVLFL